MLALETKLVELQREIDHMQLKMDHMQRETNDKLDKLLQLCKSLSEESVQITTLQNAPLAPIGQTGNNSVSFNPVFDAQCHGQEHWYGTLGLIGPSMD